MNAENKNEYESKKLILSVISICVMIVIIAGFCTSGTKGSAQYDELYMEYQSTTKQTEQVQTETHIPLIETVGNPAFSDSGNVTSKDTNQGAVTTDKPTQTSKPKDDKPIFESSRPVTDGETFIGEYTSEKFSLDISHVQKGDLSYFICDIVLSSPDVLKTAFAGGKITGRLFTSKIASSVDAVFAVNGDFCGFRSDGIIIRNGKLYRDNKSDDWDLLYMDKNGDLNAVLNDEQDGKLLVNQGVLQTWCFGPALVKDGAVVSAFNSPGLSKTHREPRTAIGQIDDLHYVILIVDAVRKNNRTYGGMNFSELAATFKSLGCKTAYNLDGGGSTTLYFKGNVINKPCVNGERQVSDIVYLPY